MSQQRTHILIVDDVEVNRTLLSEVFKDEYIILEAENGEEAIDIIEKNSNIIAAVLLDIIMPKLGGIETLRILHGTGFTNDVPVFFITADPSEENMQLGYDMGIVDIIQKPIVPRTIKIRVNNMIELYKKREQLSHVVDKQEKKLKDSAQEIQELNAALVTALAAAIEFRDFTSGEHVNRIYELTEMMFNDTDLRDSFTEDEIQSISIGAIMHDIGKISIPDNILNKPGKLTIEECECMKTHTIHGCDFLDRIPKFKNNPVYNYAYDICRHHHERHDGKGYPDGLSGDEISIWAQVASIVDAYDALVSDRVYKKAYSHEQAFDMITSGKCGMFNPKMLERFVSIHDKIVRELY